MIPYNQIGTIKCYIKHVNEGYFDDNQKILYTQLGKSRRVRLFGTLTNKKELISNPNLNSESTNDDFLPSNSRIEFTLDDGTGIIKAIAWNKNLEDYEKIQTGRYVELIGFVRKWRETMNINLINIKPINNFDKLLLRDAEIIEKIKKGKLFEVPKEESIMDNELDDFSEDLVVETLFEEKSPDTGEDLKQKIYDYVRESSDKSGVAFEDIKSYFQISEIKLKQILRKLEMESKIYRSEGDIYQTY